MYVLYFFYGYKNAFIHENPYACPCDEEFFHCVLEQFCSSGLMFLSVINFELTSEDWGDI